MEKPLHFVSRTLKKTEEKNYSDTDLEGTATLYYITNEYIFKIKYY